MKKLHVLCHDLQSFRLDTRWAVGGTCSSGTMLPHGSQRNFSALPVRKGPTHSKAMPGGIAGHGTITKDKDVNNVNIEGVGEGIAHPVDLIVAATSMPGTSEFHSAVPGSDASGWDISTNAPAIALALLLDPIALAGAHALRQVHSAQNTGGASASSRERGIHARDAFGQHSSNETAIRSNSVFRAIREPSPVDAKDLETVIKQVAFSNAHPPPIALKLYLTCASCLHRKVPRPMHARVSFAWQVYDAARHFARLSMSVHGNQDATTIPWRLDSAANASFELCPTYPKQLILPQGLDSTDVLHAAKFRTKRRLPAVVWFHNSVALLRSS